MDSLQKAMISDTMMAGGKINHSDLTVCVNRRLTLVAVGDDKKVLGETTGELLVQDELRSGDATLVLSDSDGDEVSRTKAERGITLAEDLSLDVSQELKVRRSAKLPASSESDDSDDDDTKLVCCLHDAIGHVAAKADELLAAACSAGHILGQELPSADAAKALHGMSFAAFNSHP